jgi:WD40 repeat protein
MGRRKHVRERAAIGCRKYGSTVIWLRASARAKPGPCTITWRSLAGHNGRLLASGSYDATIRLWDISTAPHFHTEHGCCLATLQGRRYRGGSIAFSADSGLLASGSDDRTIHLWDCGDTTDLGQCLRVLTGLESRS